MTHPAHQPDAAIHASPPAPESCEQLLQRMVQVDTVNSNIAHRPNSELPLATWLESVARRLGLATQRLAMSGPFEDKSFNLLITLPPAAADLTRPCLLFESHLDTVSVGGMTIEPFGGKIENGKLFGRGACDTKSSGGAMLWALHRFARQPAHPNRAALLLACGEEWRKSGANAFASTQMATLNWRPAGVIVGEPTMLAPVVAHNGAVRWAIHTQGLAAHSSKPANGRSAITMMLRVVDAIESRYAPSLTASHPLTGKAQCSVNLIRGGSQINIIPDRCTIEVDRRIVPGEDRRKVVPAVEELLRQVRQANPGLEFSQDPPYIDPYLDPRRAEGLIATVRSALREQRLPDEPVGAPYGTDASTYSDAGLPALVLGPGDVRQAHTHDEWIDLDQVHQAVDFYLRIMNTPFPTPVGASAR